MTLPDWLDGDLEFAFVHAHRSQSESNQPPRFEWGMVTETGLAISANEGERISLQDYPVTQARFPFSKMGYLGSIDRERRHLKPGATYVCYWSYARSRPDSKRSPPDLAVGFTILSDRGRKEFGEIMWR